MQQNQTAAPSDTQANDADEPMDVDDADALQEALNDLRYGLVVDGRMGPKTLAALKGTDEDVFFLFLVTRLDYAGDFNGERSYTVNLESSGPVVAA